MEQFHQPLQIVSPTNHSINGDHVLSDFQQQSHDNVIDELDSIFDRIHGGREARYYSSRQH
jgi:hypothetical protein